MFNNVAFNGFQIKLNFISDLLSKHRVILNIKTHFHILCLKACLSFCRLDAHEGMSASASCSLKPARLDAVSASFSHHLPQTRAPSAFCHFLCYKPNTWYFLTF